MAKGVLDFAFASVIFGKAQEIYTQLTVEQSSIYDTIKELISRPM